MLFLISVCTLNQGGDDLNEFIFKGREVKEVAKGDERPRKRGGSKIFSRAVYQRDEEEAQRTAAILEARKAIGMADRPLDEIFARLDADPEALEIYNSVLRLHGIWPK